MTGYVQIQLKQSTVADLYLCSWCWCCVEAATFISWHLGTGL